MERHYETAVRLGHLLLSSLSLRDQAGTTASNAFLLNMNDLFEKWVTSRLALHSVDVSVRAQHGVSLGTEGTITLNRFDYGLQWNRIQEAVQVVGDEVKIELSVEANTPRQG
jgi:hypothetical protein